ncbi:AmmeMemoRadiSam system radical SAM enzyme [Amorphoplanes digitatis]|nr:AmmeMemoRadiSam system radical SAM enzyme [Actinoplanes digitatis]GID96341.1 AmmeMemoRadiSam system radical SAM enzyme [Actinoplanes digitatis]
MQWSPATLFSTRGDRIRCDLCPLRCMLRDGQVGTCGVRRRTGDVLETATFATVMQHVDANERKPFYHFRPGGRSLTLAAPGCTFACGYCINHRISQYGRESSVDWDAEPVRPADVVARAVAEGADICFSYTEPSLALELTEAVVALARPAGVRVMWKSNGFLTPEAVDRAAGLVDAVNIDVKAAGTAEHLRLTGAPLEPVLDTIREFARRGVWLEITTPLIPGTSAAPDQLATIARAVAAVGAQVPWHLVRFTPTYRMTGHDPTTPADLAEAVRIGHAAGLRHVYVERALGAPGRATRCPGCDETVVRRGVWRLEASELTGGRCARCDHPIDGRWN